MSKPNQIRIYENLVGSARTSHVLILCFAAYMLTHGLNVIPAGHNIDDWGHLAAGSDWGVLGRWGLEIFYSYVLGLSFSLTLQIALAFCSMMAISLLLTHVLMEEWTRNEQNLAAGVIFLVGSSHPYWLDSNNFSTAIGAYPFAALIGIIAFLIGCLGRGPMQMTMAAVSGALLFAASLSIYQPAGLFGVLIATSFFMKARTVAVQRLFSLSLVFSAIFIIGICLYKIQSDLYFTLHPEKTPNALLELATPSILLTKLGGLLDLYIYSFRAGQFTQWTSHYYYSSFITLLWFLVVVVLSMAMVGGNPRYVSSIRIGLGAVGSAILPILGGWIFIVPDFPIRSLSLIAFPIVFTTLLLIHELNRQKNVLAGVSTVISLCVFAAGFIVTSVGWTKQQRAYERDLATAHAIIGAAVALPRGIEISIVGDHGYPDLQPVASVGQSIFENYWAKLFIFKELAGLDVQVIPEASVDCPAFPQPGSIVTEGTRAYVCLSAFEKR